MGYHHVSDASDHLSEATLSEVYVSPQDQLLEDQGQTMLAHILKKQGTGFTVPTASGKIDPNAKPLLLGQPPKSVQEYLKEHQALQSAEVRRQEDAATHVAQMEQERAHRIAHGDALDDLLEDMKDEDDDDAESDAPGPRFKRRRPGFSSSQLTSASAPVPKTKQARKTTVTTAPVTPSTTAPASSEPAGTATIDDDAASSKAGSKAGVLDKEMKMVSDKHLGESARSSSAKALIGLVPATFLVISEKRYTQSAKLRGALGLVTIQILAACELLEL